MDYASSTYGNMIITPYFNPGTPESPTIITDEMRYSVQSLETLQYYFNNARLDFNPYSEIGLGLTKRRNLSARTYARLNIKFTDWLRFTTQFQYEAGEYKTRQLREKESFYTRNFVLSFAQPDFNTGDITYNIPEGNIYRQGINQSRAYNFRNQLDFNKLFAEKHDVTAIFGTELRENKVTSTSNTMYNYDPDLLTFSPINAADLKNFYGSWRDGAETWVNDYVATNRELTNRYFSIYGNAAYTFDDRYMLNGSIRWDRTNLFATSSKYQSKPIWSVGAGWRIDNEDFFSKAGVINMLKIRTSYGIGGNIAKDKAPYLTVKYQPNNNVGGTQGGIQSRPNPDLRWEKTTTFNIGVDFSLFNNRLNGSAEYYNKKGSDLLCNTVGIPIEGFGYNMPVCMLNNGEMTNRGFEISLNGVAYADRNWSLTLNGTFGYNKNKVDNADLRPSNSTYMLANASGYPMPGDPFGGIYAFRYAGLDSNGTPQIYDTDGEIMQRQPVNNPDLVYCVGAAMPIWNGSFSTNLRYRNFELSAMMLFAGGHKVRNTNIAYMSGNTYWGSADLKNRWRNPGDEEWTDIPRYTAWESPDYNQLDIQYYRDADVNVLDATNLRLRNLSLSYTIPSYIAKKACMKNARIMIGMENVFTICKDKNVKYMLGGYERPNYMFGLNLNF